MTVRGAFRKLRARPWRSREIQHRLIRPKSSFIQINTVKTNTFRAALRESPQGLHNQVGFGPILHVQDGWFRLPAVSEVAAANFLMLGKRWQPLTRVCKVRREKSGCDNNSKLIASLFVIPPMYAGAWSRIRCTLYVSFPIASPRCLSNGRTSSIVCPCFGKLTSGGGSHRPLPLPGRVMKNAQGEG